MLDRLAALLERPLTIGAPFAVLDAIVVLGASLGPGDALTPVLAERVAAAAALWHAGGAPRVFATGGVTGRAARAEADVMADALAQLGVPELIRERASQTTRENARLTAPLLAACGVRSLWVVTQPFHARRAVRLFRAAGFDARAWPITDGLQARARPRAVRWLVREYAAWALLLLRGA